MMRKFVFTLSGVSVLLLFTVRGSSQGSASTPVKGGIAASGVGLNATGSTSIRGVSITPSTGLVIGSTQQFAAVVSGNGSFSSGVTWSLAAPAGSALSPGTITAAGLYTTPYPAPSSVSITATSVQDPTKSAVVVIALFAPAVAAGPSLTVDAANRTHAISPYIYGMNAFRMVSSVGKAANITIDRFGGDATSRYNYVLDVTSSGADWYFENQRGETGRQDSSEFNAQVVSDAAIHAKTIGTVNVVGWVAKDSVSCSFPASIYPNQLAVDSYRSCGNGQKADKSNIKGNAASDTSVAVGPSFTRDWVAYLVRRFGTAAKGGVAIYDLDNEPAWWDAVHRDVHPLPSTYDEVTNNGIAVAKAVKEADPTAEVSGPVVDDWWNYFYSKQDMETGWAAGNCHQPWSNPMDRRAHGGVPFVEYYLQQFAGQQRDGKPRLLDYLDLHTYLAAKYRGVSVGFAASGDTGAQAARLNSTRVFWDPTYTDSGYAQPNYATDANFTAKCAVPPQAPQLIPMMQSWIRKDYPGTKTAITEYNWGGMESINGALAQADILGIFGSFGLDVGTLWGAPNPVTQIPGLNAFKIYRNYDGNNSTFGDQALASVSANQGELSVYGALRTSDNSYTIVVLNKTFGDLKSTVSLLHHRVASKALASLYLYSNANLSSIVAEAPVAVDERGSTSSVSILFPAQSITVLILR